MTEFDGQTYSILFQLNVTDRQLLVLASELVFLFFSHGICRLRYHPHDTNPKQNRNQTKPNQLYHLLSTISFDSLPVGSRIVAS